MEFNFPCIGILHSCFTEKFGIPRQPGLAPLATAKIEMLPPYDDPEAFVGIDSSSHLWIQWVFHANKRHEWKARVKPPRLGGNKTLGVFATRSPTRPAPIGLSVVKFEGIEQSGNKLWVHISGVDMLDQTPILDIKPYVPYSDAVLNATNVFADEAPAMLPVIFSPQSQQVCDSYYAAEQRDITGLITQVLQQDPRPSYQAKDQDRHYAMRLLNLDVHWEYHYTETQTTICVTQILRQTA